MFRYDELQQKAIDQQKPWAKNPHFFKHVRVSALSLIKMTMHCRSGAGACTRPLLSSNYALFDTNTPLTPPQTPPKHPLNNPSTHPIYHRKRSS